MGCTRVDVVLCLNHECTYTTEATTPVDSQATQRFRTSCPFADSRPDGCICIALKEPKRVSVDYQARFCLTDRHVECRRFQKAVPEIPEPSTGMEWARSFERGTFLVAGAVAFCILLLAAAFTFRGTWAGWFSDGSSPNGAPRTGIVVNTKPTTVAIEDVPATQTTASGNATENAIPILAVTPTATAVPVIEVTPSATQPSAAATPTPSPTATPTPSPTPTPTPPAATSTPSPAVADASGPTTHVVLPGETLTTIAASYGVSVQAIMDVNGITNPDHIEVGQQLFIPTQGATASAPTPTPNPRTTYTVQPGDTLYAISQRFGVTVDALMAANGMTDRSYVAAGTVLVIP